MGKIWFKAKRYGWGWYPSAWQGWLVLLIYAIIFVFIFKNINQYQHSASDTIIKLVLPIIILTIPLLIVCYVTGEKPRWRWG